MDLILALAAILGGIAAIWAFGERVINYFDKRNSDSSSAPNFSPIQIIQGTDDEKDLVQLLELDKSVYGEGNLVPLALIREIHKRNPKVCIIAKDVIHQEVIGYIGAVPLLKKEIFENTLNPSFSEFVTEPKWIQTYDMPGLYYLHLVSVVVSPEYQKMTPIYRMLYNGFIKLLVDLARNDIYFLEVSARAVTQEGEKICTTLNMKHVADVGEIKIFHASMFPPQLRIITNQGSQLIELYQKKFNSLIKLGVLKSNE